jgi:hypothetical protein
VSPVKRSWIFLLALVFLGGCAWQRYEGPTSGRSAGMQRSTSLAAEKATAALSWSRYAGKKCFLEVHTLSESYGGESPEEGILRALIVEKLARDGVTAVADAAQADIRLSIRARVLGVDVVRRDFPPLYYRETRTAEANLHSALYDARNGSLLDQNDGRARLSLAQSYVLYIFGPLESWSDR